MPQPDTFTRCDEAFWQSLDALVHSSEFVLDRPKGTRHPRYTDFIYPVDYGYLEGTTTIDGDGIDVWKGTSAAPADSVEALLCTVDDDFFENIIDKIHSSCCHEFMAA